MSDSFLPHGTAACQASLSFAIQFSKLEYGKYLINWQRTGKYITFDPNAQNIIQVQYLWHEFEGIKLY